MKSIKTGHFPYGGQPSYRDFLIPQQLKTLFLEHHESNRTSLDPLVIAKYFNPVGAQTWYMTEFDPQDEIFFWFVTWMPFPEWGTIALSDFIGLDLKWGMKIERDLHFTPIPFSEAVSESEKHGY